MIDPELLRRQLMYGLALAASLRGPYLPGEEPPEDPVVEAAVLKARRNLNGYRPLEWDEAHP